MVFYFTSNAVDPAAFIYMGKDKVENEDLIAHGWAEDVWFHVDNLSSAHVYLRLPSAAAAAGDGSAPASAAYDWTQIPAALLTDCAQLTKANSIDGNKRDHVTVIYTPWANLRKSGDMATGQVGFRDNKLVRRVHVERRENVIVNRLNKTKAERYPDLRAEKAQRERELGRAERMAAQEKKREEAKIAEERQQLRWQKDHMYDDLHADDNVHQSSNQDRDADFFDDFM